MAYNKLQRLGDVKFRKILNQLMLGRSGSTLAREIQQEWGDFKDQSERALTRQLERLRIDAAEGIFGKELALRIVDHGTPGIPALDQVSVSVVERLEELAKIQRLRVLTMVAKEHVEATPKDYVPSAALRSATNDVFTIYSKLLQDLQKIRFDMGLDEFKGVIPGMRFAQSQTTLPDGTNIQRQLFESYSAVEAVLNRRQIAMPTEIPVP